MGNLLKYKTVERKEEMVAGFLILIIELEKIRKETIMATGS